MQANIRVKEGGQAQWRPKELNTNCSTINSCTRQYPQVLLGSVIVKTFAQHDTAQPTVLRLILMGIPNWRPLADRSSNV